MPEGEIGTPHFTAEKLVLWSLERAYKISVANIGLTDWSKATVNQKKDVLVGQYIIAEMLRSTVVETMK